MTPEPGAVRKNSCSSPMLDDAKDSSSVVGVRLGLSDSNDENVDVDDVDD